jgi:hypothetical protein
MSSSDEEGERAHVPGRPGEGDADAGEGGARGAAAAQAGQDPAGRRFRRLQLHDFLQLIAGAGPGDIRVRVCSPSSRSCLPGAHRAPCHRVIAE